MAFFLPFKSQQEPSSRLKSIRSMIINITYEKSHDSREKIGTVACNSCVMKKEAYCY